MTEWQARCDAESKLPFADRRVDLLPLRQRTRTVLHNLDLSNHRGWQPPTPAIVYGRDLLQWSDLALLHIRYFGRNRLDEVRAMIEAQR